MEILTIIIPTYNNVQGLSNNINQFKKQKDYDANSITFTISDDSENDDIKNYFKTVQPHFNRITYRKGPQSGAVHNWNACLKQVSSKYLLFVHHDEYVLSDLFLNKILTVLACNDNDVLVLPLLKEINGSFVKHYPIRLKFLFIYFPSLLFMCNPFGPPSVLLIKKDIVEEFDSNLNWFVDVEWYFRIFKKKMKTKILDDIDFQIVSDLNFDASITKKLDLLSLKPKEQKYIMEKHSLPRRTFNIFFNLFKLPVRIMGLFNA